VIRSFQLKVRSLHCVTGNQHEEEADRLRVLIGLRLAKLTGWMEGEVVPVSGSPLIRAILAQLTAKEGQVRMVATQLLSDLLLIKKTPKASKLE
jgi:hypothetical protein